MGKAKGRTGFTIAECHATVLRRGLEAIFDTNARPELVLRLERWREVARSFAEVNSGCGLQLAQFHYG